MARSPTTETEGQAAEAAAKDADPGAKADRQKAEARMGAGLQMLQRVGEVALAAAMLGGKGAIIGLRGSIPMLELYTGTTRKREEHDESEGDGGGLEKLGLTRGEAGVVRKAFTKGMLEALEISSVTHPVYDGAPVYRAFNGDGVMEPPQMLHFLALGAAAAAMWRRWEASQDPPKPEPDPDPVIMVPLDRAFEPVALRPGEYVAAPLTSVEIRRYAMRQRSLNPPRLAMLAYSGDPRSVMPVETRALSATGTASHQGALAANSPIRGGRGMAQARVAYAPGQAPGCACGERPKGGCGCGHAGPGSCGDRCGCGGRSSCSCGGSHGRSFPPARHDEDGSCASLFSISCETRWRIRDCLKVSFCDLLRCVGDELCEREEGKSVDLGKCLEDFICSFLQCLPDAICPPPERCEPVCRPKTIESCKCNFAVGE